MADLIRTSKRQSMNEVRQWSIDFTDDLATGVTVSSATATHTAPTGSSSDNTTPVVGSISDNIVPVLLGPLGQTGFHYLTVLATLSNAEKSEVRIKIRVDF